METELEYHRKRLAALQNENRQTVEHAQRISGAMLECVNNIKRLEKKIAEETNKLEEPKDAE